MTDTQEASGPARSAAPTTRSNAGQLKGHLGDFLPFIYIAQTGATFDEMRLRQCEVAPGLFAVGEGTDGSHPGVGIRLGFILPLRLCRARSVATPFLDAPTLLDDPRYATIAAQCKAVLDVLEDAFPGDFSAADMRHSRGFYPLESTDKLFKRLQSSFEFVTEVVDDLSEGVHLTASEPFRWRTHGELMAWYHGVRGTDRSNVWSTLRPLLVIGNTAVLRSPLFKETASSSPIKPPEALSTRFVINPENPNADLGVRFQMDMHGWAWLHLTLDATTVVIDLSDVYDPFDDLVAWGQEVDTGEGPVRVEIDDEVYRFLLTVLCTDDPRRVCLQVSNVYPGEVVLEGIVERATLAATFKAELRRFFTSEFDPEQWDVPEGWDLCEGEVQTRDRVLNHAWLDPRG